MKSVLRLNLGRLGGLLLLLLPLLAIQAASAQQQRKIKGTVTDTAGVAIPGVTVSEKGTPNSVATNKEGIYEIQISGPQALLVFSAVGFETAEKSVGTQTSVNVRMRQARRTLDEIVVVGYGTQRKENVTGAISSVKSKDFVNVVQPDAAQLIRGKVAGLTVVTPDGNPTATSQILLRGITTLKTGSSPLIIIDGVPGALNSVSPNDIDQIDVLKDGSAAAIYGTRGTNGVILITTKKPKGEFPASLDVNSYFSTQRIVKTLPMMTLDQYLDKVAQGKPGAVDNGGRVNWLDQVLQKPFSQTYSVNLKGGTRKTNYIASFDYTSNEGLIQRSQNKMVFPRLYINHKMFDDKLKIEGNISGYQQRYGIPYNAEVYRNALIYNPTDPVKDTRGNWTERGLLEYYNPVALLQETQGENKNTNLRMFAAATLTPIKGLDIKYLISSETYNQLSGYYETKKNKSTTLDGKNGYASLNTSLAQNDLTELTAQYQKTINAVHNFTILGGYSSIKNTNQNFGEDNYNFPTDDYTYNNIGAGQARILGAANQYSYKQENRLIGYFGRLNYSFAGKYILSASLRYEGSSKFGNNHKWGAFPAVSVAWNIKEESFLKNMSGLTTLKLRGGYGVTGTEPGAPYLSLNTLNLGGYGYYNGQWINLARPASNPNPDLRWEKKQETNFGLDFGFLDDRLTGTIDLYNRTTKDLIWDYSVATPPYIYPSMTANAGSMRNRGIEVALNVIPVKTDRITWNSGINFSANKNILLSLSNDKFISNGYSDQGATGAPIQQPTHRIQEGEPIGDFYGYKTVDIDANGHWIIEGQDGKPKPIADQQPTDKRVIGNALPKFYLNWNNTIKYKNFDLGVTMRGAFGFQILNTPEMFYAVPVMLARGNIMQKAYDNVYGKRPLADNQELQYVSYYVQNGSYWKIDNVNIGFTPKIGTNKYIKGLRLYATVSNLAVITRYKGIDPEVNLSGLTPGIDNRYRYPSVRTFTIGSSLNF